MEKVPDKEVARLQNDYQAKHTLIWYLHLIRWSDLIIREDQIIEVSDYRMMFQCIVL